MLVSYQNAMIYLTHATTDVAEGRNVYPMVLHCDWAATKYLNDRFNGRS